MAGLWLRLYTETLNDPKVQRLSGDLFKSWINLLCIAKEHNKAGQLPHVEDLAFMLRVTRDNAVTVTEELVKNGFLCGDGDDGVFYIHGWEKRQFVSDNDPTAIERKRRQRNKLKDVTRDVTDNVTQLSPVQRQRQSRKESIIKIAKHKHGEYQHVLLTDAELEKLKADYPINWAELITRLDEYIQQTGKKYKDHLLTMRNWARKDSQSASVKKEPVFTGPPQGKDPNKPNYDWRLHDPLEDYLNGK